MPRYQIIVKLVTTMLRSVVTQNHYREFHNFAGITKFQRNSHHLSTFTNSNILKNTILNIVKTQQPFYNICTLKSLYSIKHYNTCSIKNHRFSATESGLRVNCIMEFEDVKEGLANKSLVLIDVRNPDELVKHGKIPGSINIPCKSLI